MAYWNEALAKQMRSQGISEATIAQEMGVQQKKSDRFSQQQEKKFKNIKDVKNAWISFGDKGQRQRYNSLTGSYSLRTDKGEVFSRGKNKSGQASIKAYGSDIGGNVWDPLKQRGSGEQNLTYNNIDPRVISQMNESDYTSSQKQLEGYGTQLTNWFEHRKREYAASLKPDALKGFGEHFSAYMPALMTTGLLVTNPYLGPVLAAGYGISEQDRQKRAAEEVSRDRARQDYGGFFGEKNMPDEIKNLYNFVGKQSNIDSWATQQAYLNAQKRMGKQEGNFWENMKGEASAFGKTKSNNGYDLKAIMSNDNLADSVKQMYLKQAKAAGQNVSEYQMPSLPQVSSPEPKETPSTSYAKAMLPSAPEQPEQNTPQTQNPWSSDFESQMLDQFKGYGDTLKTYFSNRQQNANPYKPKFSLGGYSRTSAIGANTPTNSTALQGNGAGLAPAQSSTGKAGQSKQQSLWR